MVLLTGAWNANIESLWRTDVIGTESVLAVELVDDKSLYQTSTCIVVLS